jgi:hypothetical protein
MKKIIIILFVVFTSCKKDTPQPEVVSKPTTQTVSTNDTTHFVMETGYDD